MESLTELANKCGTDKGTRHFESHNYCVIFENYVSKWRSRKVKMMEIGIADPRFPGASVEMWKQYFSDLYFVGLDIVDCKNLEDKHREIFTFQGSQNNHHHLQNCIDLHGGDYDFIVDDGSHFTNDILTSFNFLFKHIKEGGVYFIEDLHASQAQGVLDVIMPKHDCALVYNKLLVITK